MRLDKAPSFASESGGIRLLTRLRRADVVWAAPPIGHLSFGRTLSYALRNMVDRRVVSPNVQWPRRLLYVPTMISVVRREDNVYGGVQEPDYNALTYTWGRFELPTGSRLQISDIPWRLPSICPSHFSAEEFGSVLRQIAGESGFVWVDIACIDQEDVDIKMSEIGKQADIFRRAKKVYAWLTSQSTEQMISHTSQIDSLATSLERLETSHHSFEYNELDIQELADTDIVQCREAVCGLTSDPWFTSLWTLQEAYIRDDAVLISRSGGTVPRKNSFSDAMLLINLCGDLQMIKLVLNSYKARSVELKVLLRHVEESGIANIDVATEFPMLLYSAASHRVTTQELDRIYGIMQVYEFRLGASQKPGQTFRLGDLEHELAAALNLRSATAAQLFIHLKPPPAEQAWRISQQCTMPEVYYLCNVNEECSRFSFDSSARATYHGTSTSLTRLKNFWDQAVERRSEVCARGEPWSHHYRVNLNLDAHQEDVYTHERSFELAREAQLTCPCPLCSAKPPSQKKGMSTFLESLPLPVARYSVLLLGHVTLWKPWEFRGGVSVSSCAGILVVEDSTPSGARYFRRIGICSWEAAQGHLKPLHEALWQPCIASLG